MKKVFLSFLVFTLFCPLAFSKTVPSMEIFPDVSPVLHKVSSFVPGSPEEEPDQKSRPIKYTQEDVQYLAKTIWGEARGEGEDGMRAVALVIVNRLHAKGYPSTIEKVVRQRLQFSCWNKRDRNSRKLNRIKPHWPQYKDALRVAQEVLDGKHQDITGGATHYHATRVNPKWAKSGRLVKVASHGKHLFYKRGNQNSRKA